MEFIIDATCNIAVCSSFESPIQINLIILFLLDLINVFIISSNSNFFQSPGILLLFFQNQYLDHHEKQLHLLRLF